MSELEFCENVRRKLKKVLKKGYIKLNCNIKSLNHYCPASKIWKTVGNTKVVDDNQIVYDATKYGLNDSVCDPWFPMPTNDSHLRAVEVHIQCFFFEHAPILNNAYLCIF